MANTAREDLLLAFISHALSLCRFIFMYNLDKKLIRQIILGEKYYQNESSRKKVTIKL